MQQSGEYPGPAPDDYANVEALNTAFIRATQSMKGPQRGRLSAAPFLLFSLRENEIEWWQRALSDQGQGDLLNSGSIESREVQRIQNAALGFLWQLGRRNPYAVRIISGASPAWCELITAIPLVTLLDRVGTRADLMLSRIDGGNGHARRLLREGTSSTRRIRHSLQFSVLQTLLTHAGNDEYSRLSAAACSLVAPMRVFDKES